MKILQLLLEDDIDKILDKVPKPSMASFKALQKAVKDTKMKPLKIPKGMSDEAVVKALQIGIASYVNDGKNFYFDSAGTRGAITRLAALEKVAAEWQANPEVFKKAREEAESFVDVGDVASTVSTFAYLFAQGRKNGHWSDDHKKIANEICKTLGIP